ncbi:unnamed protein product [Microthlaspi erraticum]|uniref:Uncharacterized protein n=1 Tax=Microthlaspi erraticum TaxID=1685480 RepID=A0A6D2HWS8_9BRAS|nr:unnamed protein product [Microthlaspi erraticum]
MAGAVLNPINTSAKSIAREEGGDKSDPRESRSELNEEEEIEDEEEKKRQKKIEKEEIEDEEEKKRQKKLISRSDPPTRFLENGSD